MHGAMMRVVLAALVALVAGCGSRGELEALSAENARLKAQLAAREAPQERTTPDEAAREARPKEDWSKLPLGDLFVPWEESVDLGWARLRVREVKPCEDGKVGVRLEIANLDDRPLDAFRLRQAASLVAPHDAIPAGGGYLGPCARDTRGSIQPKSTGSLWLAFDVALDEAKLLALDVDAPSGLARYRLRFALKDGVAPPDDLEPEDRARPAPPKGGIAEPAETAFFRVTPMRVVRCGAPKDGTVLLGVELFVESFTNVPLRLRSAGRLRDDKGFEHDKAFIPWDGPCIPALPHSLDPGGTVRGFLSAVKVPTDAKGLELVYHLGGFGLSVSPAIQLALGDVPEAPAPPAEDAAPTQWAAPQTPSVSHANYRITVTKMAPCGPLVENGKMWVGVEILAENRSSQPIAISSVAQLVDGQSYHHRAERYRWDDASPCGPDLPTSLEPGTQARGWLHAFRVPVDVGPVSLAVRVYFDASLPVREDQALVAAGALR